MDTTFREKISGVLGRLDGLSGTVRYDLPEPLRRELREIADMLREALGLAPRPAS